MPPESGLSNFRMANDALLGRITRDQRPTVMRMEGELGPDAGAAAYEALRARAPRRRAALGPACCSGSGPDAHCASLFPGKPEVEERQRLVTGVELAGMEPQVPRISLTLPALNSARAGRLPGHRQGQGEGGRARVRRPARPGVARRRTCARRAGELLVVLDPAAAKELA